MKESHRKLFGVLILAAVATGATRWDLSGAQESGQETPPPADKDRPPPRVDSHGDPLPAGAVRRFGGTRFRAGSGFDAVSYAPDGKAVAAAVRDEEVWVWDRATGKVVQRLQGKAAFVGWAIPRTAADWLPLHMTTVFSFGTRGPERDCLNAPAGPLFSHTTAELCSRAAKKNTSTITARASITC
jgi:hypothetical protein